MRKSEWILAGALAVEIAIFAAIAPHFLSVANGFEVLRATVELGLLAIALTPVIVSGGIDVSVGAMMGLAAVIFGAAVTDWHLPVPIAIGAALAAGGAGGALNAFLIARLEVPPLIVTLGSMSLFRGIAEGLTRGAVNYTGFPGGFLAFGQGYLGGAIPAQLPLFVLVFAGYVVFLHRSTAGRAVYAIGFGAAGARYAGIDVRRRLASLYVLTGVVASVAAIVYVAHLGQARSDAGVGDELDAIAAVVLGGTSVFGGRGSLWGTLLGLGAISVLRNGFQLAAWPSELAGVVTGGLLLATMALDRVRMSARADARVIPGDFTLRNTQVAAICAAVIAAAMIVASTNAWLVRSIGTSSGAGSSAGARALPAADTPARRPVIAMMPKAKGDPYFISCRAGAEEAAKELGVELIWDGPTSLDAARQNELVENWITRKVDAIAVAVENRGGISSVLRKARERGIKVLTWDADAEADARDFFVNQATPEGIANSLTDEAARLLGGQGQFAIVTGALSAANQNEWIANIRKRLAEKYPKLVLATIRPSDDDRDKAFAETQTILRVNPAVKLVMAISAPAVPGAAEAVRQAGRTGDVKVIGLSLPNMNKPYVHGDVVQAVILWNTRDLGYLTVLSAAQFVRQGFAAGASSIEAGRLGRIDIRGSEIVLGAPLLMNKANIDRYDFGERGADKRGDTMATMTDRVHKALDDFRIELPSWGFANTGTRFGKFLQAAAASTLEEKFSDAGQVHALTGVCPTVALHVLWDLPEGLRSAAEIGRLSARYGVRAGSINPNLFQDQEYKFGSFGNPDPEVRARATRHVIDSVAIASAVGSRDTSLWFADGSNYPGTANIRERRAWFIEALQESHSAMSPGQRLLVEYKPFEPAFYHTDIADWGMALLLARAAGPDARVLVDTGHHYLSQNIEQIVAWLLAEGMLGGFHFNDRRYADDDLTLGSIDPYQVFRIFHEIRSFAHDTGAEPDIAYMVDQSHNLKGKIEAMIQTVCIAQELYAKAALVDHDALAVAQRRTDLVRAEGILQDAFSTDVRPAIRDWRTSKKLPADPQQAFRDGGYLERITAERGARAAGVSSYA